MVRTLLLALIVAGTAGCSSGDATGEVDGEVVLDGKPLAEGVVHFIPVDGQSPTSSTFVAGGKFHQRVPIGKHRVEISCVQARPLRPGQDADSATGVEIVPAKYNTRSELQTEVVKGKNPVRYELISK
jgi:hypothetical protein